MKKLIIPKKSYFKKAYKLLFDSEIKLREKNYDYYHLNEKIYDCEDFQKLVLTEGPGKIVKISSGTSDRKAFPGYIEQSVADLKSNKYYRNYTSPNGYRLARRSLALMESSKLKDGIYSEKDICLTSGSTGAITIVFEYIKNKWPKGEVLIATPAYYLYKFAANYWNLKYREVFSFQNNSFKSVDEVIKKITSKTKLIVITQPLNPTGEIYTEKEIKKLTQIASRKGILLLIDELFFDLIFEKNKYKDSTVIASELNALDNIAVIRGYSKNKNLAAFRLGYLLSKNENLMIYAETISEVRQCFPVASNFAGIIILDAFIQSLDCLVNKNSNKPLSSLVNQLKKGFNFAESINNMSVKQLIAKYKEYKKYFKNIMNFYSNNFDIAQEILKDEIEISIPKKSAFNTFVKIKGLTDINFFDFCFNFYLTAGIETQIGPCYAFDQEKWEENPNLGFWMRITFARDTKQFKYGLKRFIEFKKLYLSNQDRFLKTGLYF
ncbi:pyridoxal phosphate-dependent aminotransferase [Candidatus Daviesbacteria bacterium]|nr:pyridoxal phosphate-dependent aminotransferase [Candidatus Daviesbacteria bacterium]